MALVIGGKRVTKAKNIPPKPSPLEQSLINAIVSVNEGFANRVDVDALAASIQGLNPDNFDKLLDEVLLYQEIDFFIKDSLRRIVLSGATNEARSIIRNAPRVGQNPMLALEYGGKVLPNGIILPGSAPSFPDVMFSIVGPVDRMFTYMNANAVAYAATRSSQLIRSIDNSNRVAIQKLITQSFTTPRSVDDTARLIRRIIGLHPRWALAVERFHDNNFRQFIKEGIETNRAFDMADAMAEKYRAKLIRSRARTIARTEIQQAQNFGREASWKASDRAGLLDARSEKEWRTAPVASRYGPPCPICMDLRGTRVPWNGVFANGSSMPPAHPNCRCTAVLVPPTRGLTGLPSQDMGAWIDRLDALEAEQIRELNDEQVSGAALQIEILTKHYQGKHDQKTHGRWSSGKTYDQFLSEAAEIKDKADEERKLRFGDNVLYEMYDRAGYNALPTVVTSTEFDALVESGSEELFRGVTGWNPDGKDFDSVAQGYLDEFRYGEYYAGIGVCGSGTYAGNSDVTVAGYTDHNGKENSAKNVIRVTMKPGSKIISYKEAQILHMDDVKKLFDSQKKELKKYPEMNEKRSEIQDNHRKQYDLVNDLGRWAVMRGYDAIRIPGPMELMSEVYYNILNRGQVVAQDTNGWE